MKPLFNTKIITILLLTASVPFIAANAYDYTLTNKNFTAKGRSTAPNNYSDTINAIVDYSRNYIGTRYRYGGTTPKGFDCSGFMVYIFKNFEVNLPRTGTEQYKAYGDVPKDNIKKGDLVFFAGRRRGKRIGHVGMVVSDSIDENGVFQFIHSSTQRGVIISKSSEPYYASRYISACRVFDSKSGIPPILQFAEESVSNKAYHTVVQGETLFSIAKQYNIPIDSIRSINNLTDNNIRAGQNLLIGSLIETQSQTTTETAKAIPDTIQTHSNIVAEDTIWHRVKKGDTLYSLAKRYNTTVAKIKKDNTLNSSNLKIGQKLKIKK
ncbi:MAG: LysM peptidoglycan-binding domain-containing protein [Porphyromonadaceae bacterium]|nr:LysM peptidoglycan-binding domain-containing protein [Porphyromonadaceae bacterium]